MPNTIAILAPSAVPFEVGGSEKFWWGLRNALAAEGNAFVELVKLPCREKTFGELLDSYEAFSRLDLSHFDMLISTKYPAWIAPHHNHVCYMQHTLRGLYDTYRYTGLAERLGDYPAALEPLVRLLRKERPCRDDFHAALEYCRSAVSQTELPRALFDFPGPLIREVVHFFDRIALAPGQIKAWLAISGNVAARKDYLPKEADVRILPHPSDLSGFHCDEGSYFFTASRLHSNKRIRLIADAMRHVPLDIPLKIAGVGPELNLLKERFAHDPRIQFLGFVPDGELVDLYAGAVCVPYAPIDEDYGLITIEAMKSGKPVITTPDAGGVCEFVEDGATGYIVSPYPPDMGAAMTRLARDPELARAFGQAARERVASINWPDTVRSLLAHASEAGAGKPAILVCAPFQANRHGAGGPRRLYHFCAKLRQNFSVCLVCFGPQTHPGRTVERVAGDFCQITLPWTEAALREAARVSSETGQSSDDIAIARTCASDSLLLETLAAEGGEAACAVASHPWLYPAMAKALPHARLVYDAHNVEADMKTAVFGAGAIAEETRALEQSLCRNAVHIFACSSDDAEKLASVSQAPRGSISLLANGCDAPDAPVPRDLARRRLAFPDAAIAVFMGSDHKPNLEGAHAVFDMARQMPDVQFILAGTVCYPPEIAQIDRPGNIHLLGPVSEKVKALLLARADIALNPVTSGSGVNLKIMDYLASGAICLSTPFGARGIAHDFFPALQLVPLAGFPARIREILASPPDREAVAGACRKAADLYSWDNVLADLNLRLTKICGVKNACPTVD